MATATPATAGASPTRLTSECAGAGCGLWRQSPQPPEAVPAGSLGGGGVSGARGWLVPPHPSQNHLWKGFSRNACVALPGVGAVVALLTLHGPGDPAPWVKPWGCAQAQGSHRCVLGRGVDKELPVGRLQREGLAAAPLACSLHLGGPGGAQCPLSERRRSLGGIQRTQEEK